MIVEIDYGLNRYMKHVRTIFISDIHLGNKSSKTNLLLSFLKYYDSNTLYLVGDIIDLWKIRRGWYWDETHNLVIQKILRKARKGTKVVYIPGNHDEAIRQYCPTTFGQIEIKTHDTYLMHDGSRALIMHGDQFDKIIVHYKWVAILGAMLYDRLIELNGIFNTIRKFLNLSYWSLSAYLKVQAKDKLKIIENFERELIKKAKNTGHSVVVSGHIHHATILDKDGIKYVNCGDWVESCTAIVEHLDGTLEIIRWTNNENIDSD